MAFLFRHKKKQQNEEDFKVQIYSDLLRKNTYKLPQFEPSSTVEYFIQHLRRPGLDSEMATILVLIVVEPGKKDHRVLLQRRLSLLDQPVKLHRSVKWDQFVCAFDIPLTQLSDMKHYHNNVAPMFSIFKGQNHDQFDRFGTLMKRAKNGQYRERQFKLMKDCLIYFRQEKNVTQKVNYLSLESVTVERVPKEKLVFLLRVDQRTYTLKANSGTDYDGWIYSIQKQSMQVKETKLFSDYDKKVSLVQKQKMDNYKTMSTTSNAKQLLASAPEAAQQLPSMINSEFINFVTKSSALDGAVTRYIWEIVRQRPQVRFGKLDPKCAADFDPVLKAVLSELKLSLDEPRVPLIEHLRAKKPNELTQLIGLTQGGELLSEEFNMIQAFMTNTALPYIETNYLRKFKAQGTLIWCVSRIPVQRYNSYMKFTLPNLQMFWTDSYQEPLPLQYSFTTMPSKQRQQHDFEPMTPKVK